MKRALGALLAVLAVAACGGASSASGSGPSKSYALTVALPWPGKPPVCCMMEPAAKDLGYYKRQGLEVTFVNVSTASAGTIQTLVAGRADVAGAAVAAGIGAYAAGSTDIRYIGGELNSDPSLTHQKWYFGAKTSINTVSDLKGKRIGLAIGPNPTDPGYVQIHALLASAGLTDKDVTWVVAGTQDARAQALVAGRIDFTTIPMELSYILTPANGLHLVAFNPVSGNTGWGGCECWFTTASALKDPEKREAITRFVVATMQVIRDMVRSESVFKKAMGLYLDMSQETPQSIDNTWNYEKVQYQANGCMNLTEMTTWFDDVYLKTVNPSADGKVTLRQVVDPSIVKAALGRIGVDKAAYWDPPQLTFPSAS
ncbi:MAG TPA: ABC transporter substrate-binding protein [Candidatus Dormibacteraeota bacterium]|nr:ABC transporter substrate-binding protein [Candidatus Dormibacteraeota bacterium]